MFLINVLAIRPQSHGVLPSKKQVEQYRAEVIGFVHFSISSYADEEVGSGKEDPELFFPTNLNTDQWIKSMQLADVKLLILTSKHHDGFQIFQSKNSPELVSKFGVVSTKWRNGQGDVVKDFTDSCKKLGMKAGIYLSPWDKNSPFYGQSEKYNQYYEEHLNQLTSQYGEIHELWYDGYKESSVPQVYDWNVWLKICYDNQPNLLIFGGPKPDSRWNGNEAAKGADPCWSTVREEVFRKNLENQSYSAHGEEFGDLFTVVEADVSIRPGWFYHANQDDKVKSGKVLFDLYIDSVGQNQIFLLNVPPTREGQFHVNDIKSLEDFGRYRKLTFDKNLAEQAKVVANNTFSDNTASSIINDNYESFWAAAQNNSELIIERPNADPFDIIMLQEYIPLGQRVNGLWIYDMENGEKCLFKPKNNEQTTVGHKRYIRLAEPITSQKLKIVFRAHAPVIINNFGLFKITFE